MLSPRRASRFLHSLGRIAGMDLPLLIEAIAVLALVRLGLWVLPFKAVGRMTAKTIPRRREGPAPAVQRVAQAIVRGARVVPGATCLTQALAAEVLMRRAGCPAALRLGIARDPGGPLRAHAWLESDGVAVVGGGLSDYTLLPTFESLRK